jgi:hypothetical protein
MTMVGFTLTEEQENLRDHDRRHGDQDRGGPAAGLPHLAEKPAEPELLAAAA